MGPTLQAGVAPGLALAGVLAIAGVAAARFGSRLPHLGAGVVGVGVAAVAGRLTALPVAVMAVAVLVGGAALGMAAQALDERARRPNGRPLWPPPLLADVAVLGLALGAAAVLRPALSVELPVGPLGGLPALRESVLALAVGVAGAVAVAHPAVRARGEALGWALAGAVVALAVVLGSGALALRGQALAPVFAVADVLGVAVRAAAVGVVARHGVGWGLGAAVVLGLGEGLVLLRVLPALALAPAVVLLAVGVLSRGGGVTNGRATGAAPGAAS